MRISPVRFRQIMTVERFRQTMSVLTRVLRGYNEGKVSYAILMDNLQKAVNASYHVR